MKNLLTAIMTKVTGSALATDIGGRIYADRVPEGAIFPYVVVSVVSATPNDTFKEKLTETIIQFSLYSESLGVTEIGTMYSDLRSLFDDAMLTISGDTCIWTVWQNLTTMSDDVTTEAGTVGLRHWAVDYSIMVQD